MRAGARASDEPKQHQQPAPEKSPGIGVLFPFKTAIAVGIVFAGLYRGGASVDTGISGLFKSSQVVEASKDTSDAADQAEDHR
jgi:hypothetical protein